MPTLRRALLVSLPLLALVSPPWFRHAEAGAPSPEAGALVAGHNAFAVDLYGRLAAAPGNVLFSPWSIHTALSMVRAGARGETAAQMDRVLRLPQGDLAAAWKETVARVTKAPMAEDEGPNGSRQVPAYSLSVANSLWAQKGFAFVPAYTALLRDAYAAELMPVDFAQGPVVRKQINDWVLARTNQRIKDLIPDGLPTADTRLALVNAVHFLAQWDEAFFERATEPRDFTNQKGEKVKVQMMRRTDHFRTFADGDAQVLAVPYKGGATEMVLVLPTDPAGLERLEKGLTPERLAGWGAKRPVAKARLELPRFTFEAPADLSRVLVGMGMGDAFDVAKADFRGIADVAGQPLFIGTVLHKAFIAVDEKGTEAAAATAVLMRAGSAPRPDEPIPFVCDRPFLFFLRHVGTGALLFAGRLAMPQP